MFFGDDYGDQPVETFMQDCENWLKAKSWDICKKTPWLRDDTEQEGRIELWRAYGELEGQESRIPLSLHRAKRKMQGFAWRTDTSPTGNPRSSGHSDVTKQNLIHLDKPVGDNDSGVTLMDLLASSDHLNEIEAAYHYGEIQEAIASLTEGQRRYIIARFWYGMDPADGMHSNPGMKEARANNPYLKRDIYWTGSKTSKGAKKILAEKLEHLRSTVSS